MTYKQLVNNILRRLRESEVETVTQNSYSKLISLLINDAKKEIEEAWDWSALRTTLTATTQPSLFSYVLTGSGQNISMLDVINDSENTVMQYADASWMNKMFLLADPEQGAPYYYSFNGLDSNGDTVVDVYPIPTEAQSLRFNMVVRTDDLENDSDVLSIPSQPVLMLAYAKAVEERGEDGGVGASSAYATASRVLNDAIAYDAAKHPEELIWSEV